ncbi:MAG: glycerophosphodiester phosphodiesterase family protein [Parasphingopyxis sp.]|uniref:glycerophosphodiester phosphodiesterase family protein n=1 Tax=Parasphingopyxis sp. TaxID=1920299 RepID=UPI003FA09C75
MLISVFALLVQLASAASPIDTSTRPTDYLHCLNDADVTLVSGHRGGPEPGYPENAIETFAHTLSRGPFLLEVDVRQTADGVYVLMHDETLDRTTTGEGRLDATDWATLQRYRLVDNDGAETAFRTPSLAEALEWAEGRTLLQLDVKQGVDIADLTRFVVRSGARDRAAVIAYTVEDALAAAAADPHISVSVEITSAEQLDTLRSAGLDADRLMAWTGVSATPLPELWSMLDEQGVVVAFGSLWYIDNDVANSGDTSIYRRLADMGVDILSSDLHHIAFDAIESDQNARGAVALCTASLGNVGTDR